MKTPQHDLSGLPELPEGFHWEVYPKGYYWDSHTRRVSAMVVAICRDVPKRVGLFKTERIVVETFMVESGSTYTYSSVRKPVPTTPENIINYAQRCLRNFNIQQEKELKAAEEAKARREFTGTYKKGKK